MNEKVSNTADRILVIDDDVSTHHILSVLLDQAGYISLKAMSGDEGIKIAKEQQPDLIIIDVCMPRKDGYETCKQLKDIEETSNIPVVFITALIESEYRLRALECGAVDFFSKPFLNANEIKEFTLKIGLRIDEGKRLKEENIRTRRERELNAVIHRAKHEWEITVDALTGYIIAIIDQEGNILRINKTVETWSNDTVQVEQTIGRQLHDVIHPNCKGFYQPTDDCPIEKLIQGLVEQNLDEGVEVDLEDSELMKHLYFKAVQVQLSDERVTVLLIQDISERKSIESKLRYQNKVLGSLNSFTSQLMKCAKESETYEIVTNLFAGFQYVEGVSLALNLGEDRLQIVSTYGKVDKPGSYFGQQECWASRRKEVNYSTKDTTICEHLSYVVSEELSAVCVPIISEDMVLLGVLTVYLKSNHGNYNAIKNFLIGIASNYSLALSNIRLRERLSIEAIRDPLTGLYNRRFMEDALAREQHRADRNKTSLAVLMLDIDHFKTFNDTHGHDAGDEVLREIANCLAVTFRAEDVVCRYGGEEFVIIIPEVSSVEIKKRAEELCLGVSKLRISYGNHIFEITISIGVSSYRENGIDMIKVLKAADNAMYKAKKDGRNRVVVANGNV